MRSAQKRLPLRWKHSDLPHSGSGGIAPGSTPTVSWATGHCRVSCWKVTTKTHAIHSPVWRGAFLFLLVKSEIIWLNTNLSEVNFPMFVGKTRLVKSMLLIPIDSFLNLHSFPNIGYCFYSLLNPHLSLGHHGCRRREHRILRGQRRCGADLWRAGRCGGLLQGTLQPLPHLGEWRFAKNVCQKYIYIDITMYIMYIYNYSHIYYMFFFIYGIRVLVRRQRRKKKEEEEEEGLCVIY